MPYGVRKGRQTGVYQTWDECREQVDRYPSAQYKKFPSYHEAQNFVERSGQASCHPSAGGSNDVYIDGSCLRNGQEGSRGGIGVYWGPNNPHNVSERLEGRATNQRAELEAARRAVQQARSQNKTSLDINTDSKFTVDGMTKWVPKWKENGWKTSDGRDVVNKKEFENLDKLCTGMDVKWRHVPGHSGNVGNEMADQLARRGAMK
ncbi:ribonuclease H1-like [Rhinophrynus dorsalis]